MPRPSRRRVQCPDPNCQAIKSTRGNFYFVCEECRRTWDIEPNLFDQRDKNDSKQEQDSGNFNEQDRDPEDMGETGNSQTYNNKDRERGSDGGVEKEPSKELGENLEFR